MNDYRRKKIKSLENQLYTIQVATEEIAKEEREDQDSIKGVVEDLDRVVKELEEIGSIFESIADPDLWLEED